MSSSNLSSQIRAARTARHLSLSQVARMSGVSTSHLGRIEQGERFPSAKVLMKVAAPLGLDEKDLLRIAGYLSELPTTQSNVSGQLISGLDPFVASSLSEEPLAVQRATIMILTLLKSLVHHSVGK
jgi:transcriptional regulator with XRE-family HTH domain